MKAQAVLLNQVDSTRSLEPSLNKAYARFLSWVKSGVFAQDQKIKVHSMKIQIVWIYPLGGTTKSKKLQTSVSHELEKI